MGRKAMMFASVASHVDFFNRDNIAILEQMGYEVTVAANFSEGNAYSADQAYEFMKELYHSGYEVIDVPVPRSMYDIKGMINTIIKLAADMKAKEYDIVHCQSPIGGVLCRIAAMFSRKKGTKVLYFAHGFHFYKGAPAKNWIIFYTAEKLCAKITDCVLTLNKEDYKCAGKHFNTRVEYVPGAGIDLEAINTVIADRAALCNELGIAQDKRIILSVNELIERKNCKTAIDAYIMSNPKDAVLLICGNGPLMEELKQYVKDNNMEDRIIFAGFRKDIIKMFKIADIFLFTSKQEGLPVSLMQAMATGLAVLCSDIRGNSDLIQNGKGGYMYNPYDVAGFSRGLDKLLADGCLRTHMGQVNKSRVKKYDKKTVNKKMRDIYTSLLD